MNEPIKVTLAKKAEILGVELYKAMEFVRFAHTQMLEDLIYWLNHPEEHLSNRIEVPINKIKINYKEGGFSIIWFDPQLKSLQMYSACKENQEKTILNIEEQKG
jgi:hypothetical protein